VASLDNIETPLEKQNNICQSQGIDSTGSLLSALLLACSLFGSFWILNFILVHLQFQDQVHGCGCLSMNCARDFFIRILVSFSSRSFSLKSSC
jgi:hypothetical protein